MNVRDIALLIEEFAPLSLQEDYDNSGLSVGREDAEVRGILVAVDVTEAVVEEAVATGCNMIVTHHPIIFHPLRRLTSESYVERSVELAIKHDIALYAAHTNLDRAEGGTSWRVARDLGLSVVDTIEDGMGVIARTDRPMPTDEFLDHVCRKMNLTVVRHSDIANRSVERVAICTGSGGSMLDAVRRKSADVFLTADLKYNDFFMGDKGLTIVDIGHFESEFCAIEILFDVLSKKMCTFAVRRSLYSRNPINYLVK